MSREDVIKGEDLVELVDEAARQISGEISLQPATPRRVGVRGGARVGWSSLIAAALERLVCEETQERHHDPRPPAAAAASAGLTLAAWAIFHTLDDIK
jgi:hypothetical protein